MADLILPAKDAPDYKEKLTEMMIKKV